MKRCLRRVIKCVADSEWVCQVSKYLTSFPNDESIFGKITFFFTNLLHQ